MPLGPVASSRKLRPSQHLILQYQAGWMGISAVPGSGKTFTLSVLAADLIARGKLKEGQEVLVVTLVNSAVDNFSRQVSKFLEEQRIFPAGFRVRTLHGLAHDIVRERPALVGLPTNFVIVDETETQRILQEAAQGWLSAHPDGLDDWLKEDLAADSLANIRYNDLPRLVQDIGLQFIRCAKDLQLTPQALESRLAGQPALPLAEMGLELYSLYQKALDYRSAVDFDDLIRLALQALKTDLAYLERLQARWPYILEDEAQDSSRLQEQILRLLSGAGGNWVRVGDPNQAIYETFTTANPRYLREFLVQPGVNSQELPVSGRSTLSIINLANNLVRWTQTEHPEESARDALHGPPFIALTDRDDPQPNPPDEPERVGIYLKRLDPDEETDRVCLSVEAWLRDNPAATVAVLVPRNERGKKVVDALEKRGIHPIELLQTTNQTRSAVGILLKALAYLAEPNSPAKLASLSVEWLKANQVGGEPPAYARQMEAALRKVHQVEDYLYPGPDRDWLAELSLADRQPLLFNAFEEFRLAVQRWQAAILLPVDQLLLTVAQDLFHDPTNLALAYKLASLLRQASHDHPDWRLPEIVAEMGEIARNKRKFIGFSQADLGFNPDEHPGEVVVATIHKAKGLEWDRVYLLSVNSYDFPNSLERDAFIAEKYFIRGALNLPAETLAQLDALLSKDEYAWYEPGAATRQARLDYIRERLRLLYVGITRARKSLVITWNTGRGKQLPALPLAALAGEGRPQSLSGDGPGASPEGAE